MWSPDAVIRVLVEIGALVTAIAALWKGITAHAKGDANASSIEAVDKLYQVRVNTNAKMASDADAAIASRVATLSDRVHELALASPPPEPTVIVASAPMPAAKPVGSAGQTMT